MGIATLVDELIGEIQQHPSGLIENHEVQMMLERTVRDMNWKNLDLLVDAVSSRVMSDDAELEPILTDAKKYLVKHRTCH